MGTPLNPAEVAAMKAILTHLVALAMSTVNFERVGVTIPAAFEMLRSGVVTSLLGANVSSSTNESDARDFIARTTVEVDMFFEQFQPWLSSLESQNSSPPREPAKH